MSRSERKEYRCVILYSCKGDGAPRRNRTREDGACSNAACLVLIRHIVRINELVVGMRDEKELHGWKIFTK